MSHPGEWGFINKILPAISRINPNAFRIPPGDDAAILKKPSNLVLSVDGLVDGTHFKLNWAQNFKSRFGYSLGRALGWKLMGSSLSDLAAMGSVNNKWAMVFLGTPSSVKGDFLLEISRGVNETAKKYGCALVGGDTVRSSTLSLVAAVGGQLTSQKVLTRNKARVGDLLAVTGAVGDSAVGLRVLQNKEKKLKRIDQKYFVKKFFQHDPLFDEANQLVRQKSVTGCLDLSDSLIQSVDILTKASRVGAEICLERLPRSSRFKSKLKGKINRDYSGEDYALLFTFRRQGFEALRKKLKFSVIGQITPRSNGVRAFLNGKPVPSSSGFRHFK